jgi:hypothetical protein
MATTPNLNVEKTVDNAIANTENAVSNATSSAKDAVTNITNKTTETVSRATEEAKKIVESYTTSSGAIYGLILVILVAALTIYGLYVMVTGVLFKKVREMVQATAMPVLCNEKRRIPITTFTNSGNGQRRSYSFWIYINDMNKYTGLYKHVLHIGDDSTINNASPYVFLDNLNNKMYVRFAVTTGKDSATSLNTVSNITTDNLIKFMKQGIEIPYVPIQRWVHIAIVVNENVNGGTITAYVDGDISNTVSSGEVTERYGKIELANLNIDKKGDLYVGGNAYSSEGPGFSGLISKFVMYNYDLNQQDIFREYNDGPIDGLLAKLGLGAYGVRSPVYRLA